MSRAFDVSAGEADIAERITGKAGKNPVLTPPPHLFPGEIKDPIEQDARLRLFHVDVCLPKHAELAIQTTATIFLAAMPGLRAPRHFTRCRSVRRPGTESGDSSHILGPE